jgi:hypothetical protein
MTGLAGYQGTLQVFEVLGADAAGYEASGNSTQSVTTVYAAASSSVNISAGGLALASYVADRDITALAASGYTSGTNANTAAIFAYSRYQVFSGGSTGERCAGTLTTNGHTTGMVVAIKGTAAAPALTSPTVVSTGNTIATVRATTDTAPTGSSILAVQVLPAATADPSSAAILTSPTQTITSGASGARDFNLTGLTNGVAVRAHFTQTGGNVISTSSFTPSNSTPVSFGGTVPTQTGTIGIAFNLALSSYFSGGLTPFTYSVFSGSLPTGLTLNTSTGAITGTPSAAGNFTAVIRATDTGSNVANTNSIGFTISAGSSRTVTLSLTTDGINPSANLTGLKWAFFDQVNPGSFVAPTAKGTSGTTNSSGVFTTSVVGTALSVGQVGWLLITDSDGTVSQAPPGKAFSAPVIIS